MTDQTDAPVGEAEPSAIAPAPADDKAINVSEAGRLLSRWRADRDKPKEPAAPAEAAPKELAQANSDPLPEVPAETTEAPDPAEVPPIEPPRSWTKEAKDRWNALPREAQEEVARIEQSREREFRRSQNEAAETRKAIETERKQAEQARKEYETKIPAVEQLLLEIQNSQFADIKSMADVERMSIEDPFRKIQWDTHQQKLQAVAWEKQQAEQRQKQDSQNNWQKHVAEENSKAAEVNPELADPAKAKQLQSAAVELLHDKGFTDQELSRLASGEEKISIFDHRLQSLLLDGVKYQQAKANVSKPTVKPVPPVQRPGVKQAPGAQAQASVEALQTKLSKAKGMESVRAAADLMKARREARA